MVITDSLTSTTDRRTDAPRVNGRDPPRSFYIGVIFGCVSLATFCATGFVSAAPRRLDGGNVDFLHRHHRFESALCLIASGRERVGQHARGDLPGDSPTVFAPATLAFLSAIVDDRVPVTVRLFLVVRRDLKRKSLVVPD